MINLRMRRPSRAQSSFAAAEGMPDVSERLSVMRRQERTTYRCENYIERRNRERAAAAGGAESPPPPSDVNEVDVACREKMCEWSYRIVDHFRGNREIVAISFSYLDRFLDRCSCDRTAFKLAAITCLYIAMKVGSHKHVSMSSLAELSRGEFDAEHIAEMERIVLQTLSWQMHPPTTRSFIAHFLCLLDVPSGPLNTTISQRAFFFSELSIFDYFLVTENPSVIAYAAVLNAVEGLSPSHITEESINSFHVNVQRAAGIYYERYSIEAIRARLWYLYQQSEQFKIEGSLAPSRPMWSESAAHFVDKGEGDSNQSPVNVAVHFQC